MNETIQRNLERNYLTASALAVFTAFLCINLYPEHHGGPQIGRSGLLALSAAMIAMIVFIVHKVLSTRNSSPPKENAETQNNDITALTSDPARLKRMFFLWSACTILLAASLIRYPSYMYFKQHEPFDARGIGSLLVGGLLIISTIVHIIVRKKDYRKI